MKQQINLVLGACIIFVLLIAGGLKNTTLFYNDPGDDHFVDPLADFEWGPETNVRAFYPGQASLQWLTGVEGHDHPVAGDGSRESHPSFAENATISGSTTCASCHGSDLEEGTFALDLVNEDKGVAGKDPYKDISIQAAFGDEHLYLRASWETQRPRPGITHGTFQLINGEWERNTVNKTSDEPTANELGPDEFFSYEDRFAVMLAPKDIGEEIYAFGEGSSTFNDIGCFVACHSSMRQMPEAPSSADVGNDPWLGNNGLDRSDIRHYLLGTRGVEAFEDATADGNWQTDESGYDAAMQQADFENQNFLDLWQFRGARSAPMYGASNDAVMEYRHSGLADNNRGDNYWFNQDPSATQPANATDIWYDDSDHQWKDQNDNPVDVSDYAWMYDAAQTGHHAIPGSAVDPNEKEIDFDHTIQYPLVTRGPDRNAVPLVTDSIAEDDLLPRRILREGTGIRGALSAFSSWTPSDNTWSVTFRRPLNQDVCDHGDYGDWCSDLRLTLQDLLEDGQGVTVAFAIFDDHASNRYHHVTFPFTLQANEEADIVAANNSSVNFIRNVKRDEYNLGLEAYPNPATVSAKFSFNLPARSHVELVVYDLNGRIVKSLIHDKLDAGTHSVKWNVEALETGIYHYSLRAGTRHESKRLLVQ